MKGTNSFLKLYITELDKLYAKCLSLNKSRYSEEWGFPSRELNLKLRSRLEELGEDFKSEKNLKLIANGNFNLHGINKNDERGLLKCCFAYWILKSELLETLKGKPKFLSNTSKIKKRKQQCEDIKKIILKADDG